MFVDRASFDLHPAASALVTDAGCSVASAASGHSLAATSQYLATASTKARPVSGTIDIGAYEAGSSTTTTSPAPATTSPVTATPTPTTTVAPMVSWTTCASENGTCSYSGSRQVSYGVNWRYPYKLASASIACDNATFGDPAYRTAKNCDYASTSAATTAPHDNDDDSSGVYPDPEHHFGNVVPLRFGRRLLFVLRHHASPLQRERPVSLPDCDRFNRVQQRRVR